MTKAIESLEKRRRRARRILDRLEVALPEAGFALTHRNRFELLVSVVLSAQCTDERVNRITPALFERYPDLPALARARPTEVARTIRSLGLFRAKARYLVAAARRICEQHDGEVPSSRASLETLPGVGRKTAGVVSMHSDGDDALPVDTHVLRIARRLGLTRARQPNAVEETLQALWPRARWKAAHHLLIAHGRRTCHARRPACERCEIARWCPRWDVADA